MRLLPCREGGEYDAILAQHLIQHLDEDDRTKSLTSMRDALKPGGLLALGVWPESASECEAYDFLYRAAGQPADKIGMRMEDLVDLVEGSGFVEIKGFSGLEFRTKPVKGRSEFLRQCFEGSLHWTKQDEAAWRNQFLFLTNRTDLMGMGRPGEDGNITFSIKMHVVVARKPA